jgi:hypothetical protein
MLYSGTDIESYITEYTSVYEHFINTFVSKSHAWPRFPGMTAGDANKPAWYLRILVCLVMYDSKQVSLEHLLLSWTPPSIR